MDEDCADGDSRSYSNVNICYGEYSLLVKKVYNGKAKCNISFTKKNRS